jgi:hypothetical protein
MLPMGYQAMQPDILLGLCLMRFRKSVAPADHDRVADTIETVISQSGLDMLGVT